MSDHGVVVGAVPYYADHLQQFGATPRGVDWNSVESQTRRFEELVPHGEIHGLGSILDYGCGYGALLTHLRSRQWTGEYCGYDVAPTMTAAARDVHANDGIFVDEPPTRMFDRTVASGLFNVRLQFDDELWHQHVLEVLDAMWALTRGTMAFNMLTSHSDPDRQRADLYYADPARYLDLCLQRYSLHARLHHGYGLYEFTIEVER